MRFEELTSCNIGSSVGNVYIRMFDIFFVVHAEQDCFCRNREENFKATKDQWIKLRFAEELMSA